MLRWDQPNIDRIVKYVPELGIARRHVDQVVEKMPRNRWVQAAVELFADACSHEKLRKHGIGTFVAFYLRDGRNARGQFYRDLDQFERVLSYIPPELFFVPLTKKGDWPAAKLSKKPIFAAGVGTVELFSEHRSHESSQYERCHFLCPANLKWFR